MAMDALSSLLITICSTARRLKSFTTEQEVPQAPGQPIVRARLTGLPGENILTLYDAAGRETLRHTFTSSTLTLSLRNTMPGGYYLGISLSDGTQHQYPIVHVK